MAAALSRVVPNTGSRVRFEFAIDRNREIAEKLFISIKTVEAHRERIGSFKLLVIGR
jgi:Bacterial regulatory proteins, luxR family